MSLKFLLPPIAILLLGFFAGGATPAEEPFLDLSLDAALAAAKAEKKVVLVDFWASWCGPCRMMDRTTWKDPRVREWMKANTVPIKVEGDKKRDISSRYRVGSFPTVVFIKPDGKEAGRTVGYRGAEDFLPAAEAAAAGRELVPFLMEKKLPNGKYDPMARLRASVELAQSGQLGASEEALRWCVEQGPGADPAFGSQLPQAVSFLARLGRVRPEALEYLKRKRDEAGVALMGPGSDAAAAEIFGAANQALEEKGRTLAAYDGLAQKGEAGAARRVVLFRYCFKDLYEAKRFKDIARDAGDPGALGETMLKHYRQAVGTPPPGPGDPQAGAALAYRGHVMGEAVLFYEAYVGAGQTADAEVLACKLLDAWPTGQNYAAFVDRAVKSGSPTAAEVLATRGRKLLPPAELAELERVAPHPAGARGTG